MIPRNPTGVTYAVKNGDMWLDIVPGTDLLVLNAIARIIVENGYYLCGPMGFMASLQQQLEDLGTAPERIRTETFGPLA